MGDQLSLLSENPETAERKILTVSEITRRIKQTLETGFGRVTVEGEISNFKFPSSGHMYFALKDSSATISAVIWRSKVQHLSFQPDDGMKVIASGRVSVYEARGSYQLDITSMRPAGAGELQLAFERLKKKLAAEGLFDEDRKKPLPDFPRRIGIVTSPTGAALHDMVHILRRRFPAVEVILSPVRVQGPGAASEISEAIRDFNAFSKTDPDRIGIDLLIVGRGGGSIEDLWAFNEESVARAIYDSKIPVVSAVGHEIDFTIADFVADLRAPTPSAAAELVVPERFAVLESIRNNWYHIHENVLSSVENRKERIRHLLKTYSFNRPLDMLRQQSQRVDELERAMTGAMMHKLSMLNAGMTSLRSQLHALDPSAVLRRGYAIVRKNSLVVESSKLLKADDTIEICFHDGKKLSRVL